METAGRKGGRQAGLGDGAERVQVLFSLCCSILGALIPDTRGNFSEDDIPSSSTREKVIKCISFVPGGFLRFHCGLMSTGLFCHRILSNFFFAFLLRGTSVPSPSRP